MELLLKSVPEGLARAWKGITNIHFSLRMAHNATMGKGISSMSPIPEGEVIMEIRDFIPGDRGRHLDVIRAEYINDLIDYCTTLYPDV